MKLSYLCGCVLLVFVTACGGSADPKSAQNKPAANKSTDKTDNKPQNKNKNQEDDDPAFKIIKPDNPSAVSNLQDLAEKVELDADEHVVAVELSKLELDRQLKYLRRLKHIKSVKFAGGAKDEQLAAISHLKDLEQLTLNDADISDEAMKHVGHFEKLQVLELAGVKISDTGWAELKRLTRLRHLDLMYTDISDKSMAGILQLKNLETLDVSFTRVSTVPLDQLARLKSLRKLELKFTDVSDADVDMIRKKLPTIVVNGLSGSAWAANQRQEAGRQPLRPDQLAVGKEVPEIEGEDIDGKTLKLSDYRGKVVVLDFWGFWCPACVADLPDLRKLADDLKARSGVLLGVNSDANRKELPQRIKKERVTWRSWWDGTGGPIARRWNVKAWPTTYVIDHQGIIRHVNLRGPALRKAVEKLVRDADAEKKKKKKKK